MHLGQKSKVQGPLAGLLQAYPAVRLLQPEQAEAAVVPLFRVRKGLNVGVAHGQGRRPDASGPGPDPTARAVRRLLVCHEHVRWQRRMPLRNAALWMRGHAHALVEDLHHVAGEPDVHGLVR